MESENPRLSKQIWIALGDYANLKERQSKRYGMKLIGVFHEVLEKAEKYEALMDKEDK